MYGIDVITVLNKAIDNNRQYDVEFYDDVKNKSYLDFYVDVVITYNEKNIENAKTDNFVTYSLKENYTKNPETNIIKKKFLDPILNNEESIHNFKVSGFKCKSITYNKKEDKVGLGALGRVNKLEFVEFNN